MTGRRFWRGAALSVLGLALFSAVFSVAAGRGLWPQLPPGALHDTDLWAGLAGGVLLLLLLLLRRRDSVASAQDETRGHGDAETRGEG